MPEHSLVPEQRVYLAADFARRDEMIGYAHILEERGHVIVSQWLSKDTDSSKPGVTQEQRVAWAHEELDDIATNTEVLIEFTTGELCRGGRQIEFGHALGLCDVYIVGPEEVLFHSLAHGRFDTLDELLEAGVL